MVEQTKLYTGELKTSYEVLRFWNGEDLFEYGCGQLSQPPPGGEG